MSIRFLMSASGAVLALAVLAVYALAPGTVGYKHEQSQTEQTYLSTGRTISNGQIVQMSI
jgi:hypothetical protein